MEYHWVGILERLTTAAPLPSEEVIAAHGNVLAVGSAPFGIRVWRFVCFSSPEPTTLDDLRSRFSDHLVYAVSPGDQRISGEPIDRFAGVPESLARGAADDQKIFVMLAPA